MNINISGQHIDITPPLRQYITEKLERMEHHFDRIIDAHVILNVVKDTHHAEATLNVPGKSLFADTANLDMYAAIDDLCDKLDRQVRRYKDKLKDHHRQQGREENQRGRAAGGAG